MVTCDNGYSLTNVFILPRYLTTVIIINLSLMIREITRAVSSFRFNIDESLFLIIVVIIRLWLV